MKPYFENDGVRIFHGDCRDVLPRLGSIDAACVVGDPPYGETSLQWDRWPDGWLDAVADAVPLNASLWCFGSLRMFMREAEQFKRWRMSHDVVWEKQNGTGFLNDRFRKVHELAGHFYRDLSTWESVYKSPRFTLDATKRTVRKKAKPAQWQGAVGPSTYVSHDGGPRLMRSVIQARNEHGRAIHPTQKPLSILGPLLEYACPPGGLILSPFCGSGADLAAAQLLGMRAVGIEADEQYCERAAERLRQKTLFAAID